MADHPRIGAPEKEEPMSPAAAKRPPLCGECLAPIPLVNGSFKTGYEQHRATTCKYRDRRSPK